MGRNAHKIWNIWKRYFWFKINRWCIYSANKSVVCVSFIILLSCFCYAFVCVSLLMPCGNLLEKGWPLGFRYDALLWSCPFPIGIVCCFTSQVNSYGHCGMVSSPNHTFSWAGSNKRITSNSCTYFPL